MSTVPTYDLPLEARSRWATWLKSALKRAGNTQLAVAIALEGGARSNGTALDSQVSRFVRGEPAELRTWFTQREDWLGTFATHAHLAVEQLRERLAALGLGAVGEEAPWHPAFPDLSAEEVEIPAALEGDRGEPAERMIDAVLSRIGAPDQWDPNRKLEKVGLIGPTGRSRDIAARQIRDRLQQRLDTARAEAIQKAQDAPADGRRRARRPQEPREIPVLQVEIATAPAESDIAPGVLRLLVVDEADRNKTENLTGLSLRLVPWGPPQAAALARRLAESARLPAQQATALRAFARRVDETPANVDAEATPDLIIRLLAEVARRGCPETVPRARDLLARAAWAQAHARGGPALAPFDERLMDHLMAGLATRARSAPNDVRCWTWAPRGVVLGHLRVSLTALLGPAAGRPLAALVEEAKQAKGAERPKSLERIAQALASEPAEDVLEALVAGGVFTVEQRYTGPFLRVTEPTVAAIWAARGLGELPPFDAERQRLLDADWLPVLDELARRGLRLSALQARLEACPEDLSLDAAAWMVRFATVCDTAIPVNVLLPAWATMVWAETHGMYTSLASLQRSPWDGWLPRALRALSARYRDVLPAFQRDPFNELSDRVPEVARALVARWRRTPAVETEPGFPMQSWGFLNFVELKDRDSLRYQICDLCPDQVVPTEPWSLEFWEGRDLGRGLTRLVERAKAGDDGAARLLDGRAWLAVREDRGAAEVWIIDGPRRVPLADQIWHHLPKAGLLSWILRARHAGPSAARLLQAVAGALKPEERGQAMAGLLTLAERAGVHEMEGLCACSLLEREPWVQRLEPDLALQIAGRLKMVGLLDRVVMRPREALPLSRLRVQDGAVWLDLGGDREPMRVLPRLTTHGPVDRVTLPVNDEVLGLEELAHGAAVELYRLGHDRPLRERWTRGPEHLAGLRLWRDVVRVEGLFSLLVSGFPSPYFQVEELLCLGGLAPKGELGLVDGNNTALNHIYVNIFNIRQFTIEALLGLRSALRPEVLAIADGLVALLVSLPDALPTEVEHLLTGGHRAQYSRASASAEWSIDAWRDRAARALVDLGDDAPLRVWASTAGGHHVSTRREYETAATVDRWLEEDETHLDRAWEVVQGERAAGRLKGERLDEAEWRLLARGSARAHRSGGSSTPSRGPARPRHYVLTEALRTRDADRWMRLHELNRHHGDWVPVIRKAVQSERDPRTRAALALDLSRHEPTTPELPRALRHWALDDADPFLGGAEFDWQAGRAVGGVTPLLKALAALDEPWVEDGLHRLWRLALCLPISKYRPTFGRPGWGEPRPAEPMALVPLWGQCPSPLAELAPLMETRGLADELLRAWTHPPREPEPVEGFGGDRPTALRRWLRPWWLRLASSEALHQKLLVDLTRVPEGVVDELMRRRAPGLEGYAAHLARATDYYILRPLLETDPGAAVHAVAERAAHPVAPIRMELATALDDAGSRWFHHLAVLRQLRREAWALEPQVDAPPGPQAGQADVIEGGG